MHQKSSLGGDSRRRKVAMSHRIPKTSVRMPVVRYAGWTGVNTRLRFPYLRYNIIQPETSHPDDEADRPGPERAV